MITTIYFVRHGQTAANAADIVQGQTDVPLDETGLKQAEIVGKRLRGKFFDRIFSSDLSRAALTAQHIAVQREIEYTAALREWKLGVWEGLSLSDIRQKYAEEYRQYAVDSPEFAVPGGESSQEFFDRASNFLDMLPREYPGQTILCVSHGGFLRMILKKVLELPGFPNRPNVDNTSINCFRHYADKGWRLITWNDFAHLENSAESSGW